MPLHTLLLLILMVLPSILGQQAVVYFEDTAISIEEGVVGLVTLRKTGVTSSQVTVVVKFQDGQNAGSEFVGTSQVILFSQSASETKQAAFLANDDIDPEAAESFTLTAAVFSGDAIIVNPSQAVVTIPANDDAFGVIGFDVTSDMRVSEDSFLNTPVVFTLRRDKGLFGDITVQYQVQGGPNPASEDVSPTSGTITMLEDEATVLFVIMILRDEIPETDETFTVRLVSTTGGATLDPLRQSIQLTIALNDSPLRFSQPTYAFHEDQGTVTVTVYRSLTEDGSVTEGPVIGSVSVEYWFQPGSASPGIDYVATNGSLLFSPGEQRKDISFAILEDEIPELGENILIMLANPSSNGVLANPSGTTVTILPNDDQHGVLSLDSATVSGTGLPPLVMINEDTSSFTEAFFVVRNGGAFGTVTVMYEIVRNDSNTEPVSTDVKPVSGLVTLVEDQMSKTIPILIEHDTLPEEAEVYTIRLLSDSVTGGARVSGYTEGALIVADSDNAYGVIQFSSDTDQSIMSDTSPRKLQLAITRGQGSIGDVLVNYTATYSLADGTVEDISNVLDMDRYATTIIPDGSVIHRFEIIIKPDAFLSLDSTFTITILNVELRSPQTIVPPSSPVIGGKPIVLLRVTSEMANGEIGFDTSSDLLTVTVEEPEGENAQPLQVSFTLTRQGTSGTATVSWLLTGNQADVTATYGQVFFPSGASRATLTVGIVPDDIAETEETLKLDLVEIVPSNQILKAGHTRATIIISENDKPGGIFEFDALTVGPYFLLEGGGFVELTIVRIGGSLVTRSVRLYAEGDNGGEFFGVPNVAVFPPGVTSQTIFIAASADGIPELQEGFVLTLQSYGNPPSELGSRTKVNVSIIQSDDPNGVFEFDENPTIRYIDESIGDIRHQALFPVKRTAGLFGEPKVSWKVLPRTSSIDLSPINGTLTFHNGDTLRYIDIIATDDDIPEAAETFYVTLTQVRGGGRLGTNVVATLNINKNDDAIFFEEPIIQSAEEGDSLLFTVRRNGTGTSISSVDYRTVRGTARDVVDFVPLQGTLEFGIGVFTETINVTILDDSDPEIEEYFEVELFNPIGDVVVYGAPIATIYVYANDDPNGVFSFLEPTTQIIEEEGNSVTFQVQRQRGTFGRVRVIWEIFYNGTTDPVPAGEEFELVRGYMDYVEGQAQNSFVITTVADGIPEFVELYDVVLSSADGGGRLSDLDPIMATVQISENDQPYGSIIFPTSSLEKDVAEDFNPGDGSSTRTTFTVERSKGSYGKVAAVWEIFTDSVSGTFPMVEDMLFLGEYQPDSGVTPLPGAQRPHTGTQVISFSGSGSAYMIVPEMYHLPDDSSSGLSISAWIQPYHECDGFIMAKVAASNQGKAYYSLKVKITGPQNAYLECRYSTETYTNIGGGITYDGSNLADGNWHLILVTVDNTALKLSFYVDGVKIGENPMIQASTDGPGIQYVGSLSPGTEMYVGLLQDVRLFSRMLQPGEIDEIYNIPASTDVTPISGYVTFESGVTTATISVSSLQDIEEEGNEVFTVNLLSSNGGAVVDSEEATALLTVLKSDNANGLFGFDGHCLVTNIASSNEDVQFQCPIMRYRGDEGVVTIPWEIRHKETGILATEDFYTASGEIVFPNGIRENMITFAAINDMAPEDTEHFEIMLLANLPLSDDGLIGSTITSGASIDPEANVNNITIFASDFPRGLIQFSTDPPPSAGDPLIPPAYEMVTMSVPEEIGVLTLLVVRAQGLMGDVTMEWRTIDGSAVSAGKEPIDFVSGGGTLSFADQQRFAYIDITIVDNNIAELDKIFQVQLSSPTGGAEVGPGSIVEVTIESSDNAYGTFQIADDSLELDTPEAQVGFSAANVQIMRNGGNLGVVNVSWFATADVNSSGADVDTDLVVDYGIVTFDIGQISAVISVLISPDDVPELDEVFYIHLLNSTAGQLGEAVTTTLTVLANDDPYGVFVFEAQSRSITTDEEGKNVTLTLQRNAGTVGSVMVTYATLLISESLPNLPFSTRRAAEDEDFVPKRSTAVFLDGQLSMDVEVSLLDDDIPETDETVFVYIVDVMLLASPQVAPVLNSPRIGSENIASITITANDNANGVLQLSSSEVTVLEESMQAFINVTRSAGGFGLVTVKFLTIAGTAQAGVDYSVTSSDIILLEGETFKALPIEILNDRVPEAAETFQVRLLDQITGGAVLGAPIEALITIAPSDDPNGNFGFGFASLLENEPLEGGSRQLLLSVLRRGGTMGVVAVTWEARLNSQLATGDVFPTGGTLFFLTDDDSQTFTLRILPDDVPEEREDIILTLVNATGGGVIGDNSEAVITIEANDNPHGIIDFSYDNNDVEEDGIANVKITRSAGTFGELEVTYETQPLDLLNEIASDGKSALDFFAAPIPGSQTGAKTIVDVSRQSNPVLACAQTCFLERACGSFEHLEISGNHVCAWSVVNDVNNVISTTGFMLYVKETDLTQSLYDRIAQPGVDYVPVSIGVVSIAAGEAFTFANIVIMNDTIPEQDEVFKVNLLDVSLVDKTPLPQNAPQLGPHQSTKVTIVTNDDANGIWRIYSNSPDAIENGQRVMVEETERLTVSVELIVERQGGSIGDVSVSWRVAGGTATPDLDFSASGGTLNFPAGQTRQILNIGIKDDTEPEIDESLMIELYNPVGGSRLGPNSGINITILANDNVAGILSFQTLSYIVTEGQAVDVIVDRTQPAMGTVTVDWNIEGQNGLAPRNSFQQTRGSLIFLEGQLNQTQPLYVLADDTPEVNEEYIIIMSNVQTLGVSATGAAALDPRGSTASITVQASDEPHGVFSFAQGSDYVVAPEADITLQIFVERKFGSIGVVRVYYDIMAGALNTDNTEDTDQAIEGQDFVAGSSFLEFADGVSVQTIPITIQEDEIPELNEVFLVNLTSVELVDPPNSNTPPRLGTVRTISEVTIGANDGTQGVVKFENISDRIEVSEGNRAISVTVLRDKGTYGRVTVFIYSQPIEARRGTDYNFNDQPIVFRDGESRKEVRLQIFEDDTPEDDESFELILNNPQGGLVIGQPDRAIVTILANDDAYGIISFAQPITEFISEPPGTDSVARFNVIRERGTFGDMQVPYVVLNLDGTDGVLDVTPTDGFITFAAGISNTVLQISAERDSEPELEELFQVFLLSPVGGARLGDVTNATIVIKRNDAPFGNMQIFPIGSEQNTIDVEEDAGTVYFTVERGGGNIGIVTVDWTTVPDTAISPVGDTMALAVTQNITGDSINSWHTFTSTGHLYLLMVSESRLGPLTSAIGSDGSDGAIHESDVRTSMIYRWHGVFVPVQTIETDGGRKCASHVIQGITYLAIANQGSIGRHRTTTRIYRVQGDGTLDTMQDIITDGASDVEFFTIGSDVYLLITTELSNSGQTNVNSQLLLWNGVEFIASQYLNSNGARAAKAFTIGLDHYVAIVNYYDTTIASYELRSTIFRWERGSLVPFQQLDTQGATDVDAFSISASNYLVIANSQQNDGSTNINSNVYLFNPTQQQFILHQNIPTQGAQSVSTYVTPDLTTYLAIANAQGSSVVYYWNSFTVQFEERVTFGSSYDIEPVMYNTLGQSMTLLASANFGDGVSSIPSYIYQVAFVDDQTDFISRSGQLTFNPEDTSLTVAVELLDDDNPEDDESFLVILSNPTEGAELGTQSQVTVNILSNDDAHGIISISEDSRDIQVEELSTNNPIILTVERQRGTAGYVSVEWVATGDHGDTDIHPLTGQVDFAHGVSTAAIVITVSADTEPELDEITFIQLTRIVNSGSPDPNRGATISPEFNTARMTILANDSPHGVFSWTLESLFNAVYEPEGSQPPSTVTLSVQREQGSIGQVQVYYKTVEAVGFPDNKQAELDRDFVYRDTFIIMADGATSASVTITVLPDSDSEGPETFFVNMTRVELSTGSPIGGAAPSVKHGQDVAEIIIGQNDFANGILQLNATKNTDGDIEVYEGSGTTGVLELPVSRSAGAFGVIGVSWLATTVSASTTDFNPQSGNITFREGQREAIIFINIVDDTIYENDERFTVSLYNPSGGAVLGSETSVIVKILKNDSPMGLFKFLYAQETVVESQYTNDPEGEVTFFVERIQGTQGTVEVIWELEPAGSQDLWPPSGTLIFNDGVTKRPLTLQAVQDSVLEGEERFDLSIVSVTYDAEISPVQGTATVVIQADTGSSGIVSVLPLSRSILVGEPMDDHDGTVIVHLTRGAGIFGRVTVNWQMTPRDETTFKQTSGTVIFEDRQQNATIMLQTLDDQVPELPTTYTLQLSSVTGGASIDPNPDVNRASVTVVASDNPHGIFEFAGMAQVTVNEDRGQVRLPVFRNAGILGDVRVSYTTIPDSALQDLDYTTTTGDLVFNTGIDEVSIFIDILPDDIPEGPEAFLVNLTNVRLVSARDSDFIPSNGLSLDLPPILGPMSLKTVTIERNDNAEGIIEFAGTTLFEVQENVGTARIPVVRSAGTFGHVTARFESRNVTATPGGMDYSLTDGEVIFLDGQSLAYISIPIIDDQVKEFSEYFEITLIEATGGAVLGGNKTATVVIAKSDGPDGLISFAGSHLDRIIPNPGGNRDMVFTIELTGGMDEYLVGAEVRWRLLGPNSEDVLQSPEDISTPTGQLQGSVTFAESERGSKDFTLRVKPYSGPEVEETYIVEIYQIVGAGEINNIANRAILTIQKYGDPNGVIQFYADSIQPRYFDEPPDSIPSTRVAFPLRRREGVVGDVTILWEARDRQGRVMSDVSPANGSVFIQDGMAQSQIMLNILSDLEPELMEKFTMVLTGVVGGAEIDPQLNVSTFYINPNDDPHGVFAVYDENQAIKIDNNGRRYLLLNVSRLAGTDGDVKVRWGLVYNQGITGAYVPSTGDMTCRTGMQYCTESLYLLNNNKFLERDTSFTVNITTLQYLGPPGVTVEPVVQPGSETALIVVPQDAANSLVGFRLDDSILNEESLEVSLVVERIGAYGTISILWEDGYEIGEVPDGYFEGIISPVSGSLTMTHGQDEAAIQIILNPSGSASELFAVHLTDAQSPAAGGARLNDDFTTVAIDSYGIVAFAEGSRQVRVQEANKQMELTVERSIGTYGSIRVGYQTHAYTALPGHDYVNIKKGVLTMEAKQQSATILVSLLEEDVPELEKVFYVNITGVERMPSSLQPVLSPRLSSLYAISEILIEGSNDPYGVLSLTPDLMLTPETDTGSCKYINLVIQRTGGTHGEVRVTVRTVGGGEIWQSRVTGEPSNVTNTIGQALGNAATKPHATVNQDYNLIDTPVIFRDGERSQDINVIVCDDEDAEPAELFFVYLENPEGGARIAQGQSDNGLKGFTQFTIEGSDDFNGVIGFHVESLYTSINEDTNPSAVLTLDRGQAYFDNVMVEWHATYSRVGDISQDGDLYDQLEVVAGIVECQAGQRFCQLPIALKQDEEPEFAKSFLVELLGAQPGASLDPARKFANVTMTDSDYPYGLMIFTADTRVQAVDTDTERVTVNVERIGGGSLDIAVSWTTDELGRQTEIAGITMHSARPGADYVQKSGVLQFPQGQRRATFDIVLLPGTAPSSELFPKQFHVQLYDATKGASVHEEFGRANITIVVDEKTADMWDTWYEAITDTTDNGIYGILQDLFGQVQGEMTPDQLSIATDVLDSIVTTGGYRQLPADIQERLMNTYCELMEPTRSDTRGAYELAKSFTNFAYTLVTDFECETQERRTLQCDLALVEVARWSPERINGQQFSGKSRNTFTLPDDLLAITQDSANPKCEDIHFIEYGSQQWFYGSGEPEIMNNQVISVGIKGAEDNFTSLQTPVEYRVYTQNVRVTPKGASCVLFNGPSERWLTSHCTVKSDDSDYVECACTHLSEYGALAETDNHVGYSVYIYVSCYICITCMALAILAHNVCSVYSMFAAKLLMHMCFACMALEVVFVTSAHVSSWVSLEGCAVLGVLIHYFFLAQFSWMLIQSFNLWKVFVMNDEHTNRYYIIFFVTGWSLPVVLVVLYIVIAYAVFEWPFYEAPELLSNAEVIYGDIHRNGDICFMPNGYGALASAVGPALLAVFAIGTVFIQAYQVKPQWKRYDDIYMGRYNTTEIQLMLIFWTLLCITWLFGGLHMAFSQLWTAILFCMFNIILGLYAFIVYTILRNQLCRPTKGNYSLNNASYDNSVMLLDNGHYPNHSTVLMASGQEKGSKVILTKAEHPPAIILPQKDHDLEWDAQSIGRQSQRSHHSNHSHHSKKSMNTSRAPSVHSNNNFYPAPPFQQQPIQQQPPPQQDQRTPPQPQFAMQQSPPRPEHDDDEDSQDFDDLIFALKTGGAYVSSAEASPIPPGKRMDRSPSRQSQGWDQTQNSDTMLLDDTELDDSQAHYEMRRINIADTHL
ncbi:adhesion G-protein coupled receptor V1-like [Amphiura filiformis]|uniref:adhesion G-protein coupled receptor V1-like n=1 Tax=Amphiura filiformis TaxID=82378 RepID=UPI003B20E136